METHEQQLIIEEKLDSFSLLPSLPDSVLYFSLFNSLGVSTNTSVISSDIYNLREFRKLDDFRILLLPLEEMLAVLKSLRNSGKLIFPSLSMSASSSSGSIEPFSPVCYKRTTIPILSAKTKSFYCRLRVTHNRPMNIEDLRSSPSVVHLV